MADTRNQTERHDEEFVELSNEEMEQLQGGDCTVWKPTNKKPGCQVDETYLYYRYYAEA